MFVSNTTCLKKSATACESIGFAPQASAFLDLVVTGIERSVILSHEKTCPQAILDFPLGLPFIIHTIPLHTNTASFRRFTLGGYGIILHIEIRAPSCFRVYRCLSS
jgi:hypothetical protein